MTLVSSLRGRIFLASALLAVLSIAAAIFVVNQRVTKEAESALQREIRATGALVDQLRTTRTDTVTVMARLIADLPKLKAAVETNDPPTVQDIAVEAHQESDFLRRTLPVFGRERVDAEVFDTDLDGAGDDIQQ